MPTEKTITGGGEGEGRGGGDTPTHLFATALTAEHTDLLSSEKLCLAKIGYQPKCHTMYIASGWFSAKFCLADKFAKQKYMYVTSQIAM